jgi:hypothetical protein
MTVNRIARRLDRLEKSAGHCPICDGDSLRVVRYRQQSPAAEPVLLPGQAEPGPCPACGRQPDILEVVEVIIHNRSELPAAVALAEGERH